MFPFETDPDDRKWFVGLALVAFVQAVVVAAVSWNLAGGHFMLPLDDSYIHLQYARQLAAGSPLVYTEGAAPSGGMTSPLYVLLLSPALALGFDGVRGAAAAFAFGVLQWMLLPVWTYQLTKRLSHCLPGAIAGGLVLANGHLLWNFLSGMETGVYTLLLLGGVLGAHAWWQAGRPHGRLVALAAVALLPLVRPEGVLLAVAGLAVALRRGRQSPAIPAPLFLLGFLMLGGWLAILWVATGDWRPAGLTIKGLSSAPYYGWADRFAVMGDTLAGIVRFHANLVPDDAYAAFKGTTSLPYLAPGLAVAGLFGAGMLVVGESRDGRPAGGTLLVLAWLLGLASVAASGLPFIHQQRYLAPYTVLLVVLGVVGLWRLSQLFQQHEETALKAVGLALLVASLPSLVFWTAEHGRNSRDIFHLLRRATFPLAAEREPVAITDAGVLAYYTNGLKHDLVGLGSGEFTRATPHGEGAVLEALSRLAADRRPRLLVSYPNWWSPAFPRLAPEWSVSIPRTSITSGIVLEATPVDWGAMDAGDRWPGSPGERALLEVDVADLASERTAVYTFAIGPHDGNHRAWPQPLAPTVRLEISDGSTTGTLAAVEGARIVRGEAFHFAPATFPAGVSTLVMRIGRPATPVAEPAAERLRVAVVSNTTGYRAERTVPVPETVRDVRLDLGSIFDEAGGTAWTIEITPEPHRGAWTSAHYWLAAPTP